MITLFPGRRVPCPRLLSALVSWLFLGGRWKGASPGMGSGAGHIRTSRPAKYMNQAIARRGLRGSSGTQTRTGRDVLIRDNEAGVTEIVRLL